MCTASVMLVLSYGFVLLKIKKALPSGIGVIFSFFTSSEITGRGPDGTSGSSSSTAVSSLSSSSSLESNRKCEMCVSVPNFSNYDENVPLVSVFRRNQAYLVIFLVLLFVTVMNEMF